MRTSVHDDPFGEGCKPTGSRVGARIPQLQIEAPSPLAGGLGVSGSSCGAGMELFCAVSPSPLCCGAVDWRQPWFGQPKTREETCGFSRVMERRRQRLTAAGGFGSAARPARSMRVVARWSGELVSHANLPIGGCLSSCDGDTHRVGPHSNTPEWGPTNCES